MTSFRLATTALAAIATVHVVAKTRPNRRLADLTQPLLMPAVAAVLTSASGRRDRQVIGVLAGLGASWLGDTVPRFQNDRAGFITMMGCFVGAHAAYLTAFGPAALRRARSRPRRLAAAVAAYGALAGAVLGATLPAARAAGLAPAVVGYGALLTATGVLTSVGNRQTAIGGALFVASDSLIALGTFAPNWRPRVGSTEVNDAAVMATYIAAQTLLAVGAAQADSPE